MAAETTVEPEVRGGADGPGQRGGHGRAVHGPVAEVLPRLGGRRKWQERPT